MRLTLVGNIPVDITLQVGALPGPGDDVLASAAAVAPGGSFHVLAAARAGGLPARFVGRHGTGPLGDRVRSALASIDCEVVLAPDPGVDTGVVVTLVDATGERTFVSSPDSVTVPSGADLAALSLSGGDVVSVSGYSLGLGAASRPLATWAGGLPASVLVFCDLGPYAARADVDLLAPVLARVDWLACNAREAAVFTGRDDARAACAVLAARAPRAGVLLRLGAEGCLLYLPRSEPVVVPAAAVTHVCNTTGAGDTHSGAFLAALAAGAGPEQAVATANAAAAGHVSSHAGWGPERAPGEGGSGGSLGSPRDEGPRNRG